MTSLLPILERRAEIEQAIARHQVVVVCGQTGSGKTTQLPQICLDMNLAGRALIGHTQPRRIAARAVAARIAEERGEPLGASVGVKVRFLDDTSPRTRIKVMTDGILLAELGTDPQLRAYGIIIIDEAHERSLNIDFLLGYLRELLPARPDLKLVVTSATIDPARFSAYFGGPAVAPVIEASGRMFPVEVRYRGVDGDEDEFERVEIEAVTDVVQDLAASNQGTGDMLVFLPGEREIRLAAEAIRRRGGGLEVLPLYSRLSNQEQDRVFHPGPARRVILATNVAETSLTVPRIKYVVDTGLARISRYDPRRKIQCLPVEPISRASTDQRAGRCGRVAAGVCVRLFSEASYRARPAFTDPEIRRTNLAGVILRMKSLGLAPIEEFPFLDAPDAGAIRDGYETLFELGAIDAPVTAGTITAIGRRMSKIPTDPRIARMLLGAEREGALSETIVLGAAFSIQDPRDRPAARQQDADRAQLAFRHESSDFLTLLNIWDQYGHAADSLSPGPLSAWCRDHFLSAARMREWRETVAQLRDIAAELGLRMNDSPARDDTVHRSVLTGLITNVACREGESGSFDYRAVRGNTVSLFPGSVLFKKSPKWIVAAELVHTTKLYARTAAKIDPAWIEELAGHMFQHHLSDKHLDGETGRPSAWERVMMSGIVVVPRRRIPIATRDPAAARSIFVREGLAQCRWKTEAPWMVHNRSVLNAARQAEARLRRRDVLVGDDALADWFAARLPHQVIDPDSLEVWLQEVGNTGASALRLSLVDVLRPEARLALDQERFPVVIAVPAGTAGRGWAIVYALAPGKDEDGVTVTVPLLDLTLLTPDRAAWLVPGMLPELIQALIKALPKPHRAALESRGSAEALGAELAHVLDFGAGSLPHALSDAITALHDLRVDPGAWSFKGLPDHLRFHVRVIDDAGKELAAGRDVGELRSRLEGRLRRAQAARARSQFERTGLTTWDFDDLPEHVETERDGRTVRAYPALVDGGDRVSLTLLDSEVDAARATTAGVRRLFVLASRSEIDHHLEALPQWGDMTRHFQPLGTVEQLRDNLALVVAERVFMAGQPPIRTRRDFEARSRDLWGRLGAAVREVGDVVARTLEPRSRVAQRLSGGTPRLWADSVADLREQAAYLMPHRFLSLVPWERLRHYPRYVGAMRERLFSLREEGAGSEAAALRRFQPLWKRFTAHVARSMNAQREESDSIEASKPPTGARGKAKAPLPQSRRAAPVVNVDAGEWAMVPGHLSPAMERYRWALEDLRLTMFAGNPASIDLVPIDSLWRQATA